MNPTDLGDLASVAAAIIALGAIGVAIWSATISTKSLGTAERSARAAETSADADEEMVRLTRGEADTPEVPWHLIKSGKSSCRLMNNSDKTAHDVHISGNVLNPSSRTAMTLPHVRPYGYWMLSPWQTMNRYRWHGRSRAALSVTTGLIPSDSS